MNRNDFIQLKQFSLNKIEKEKLLLQFIKQLHFYHERHSNEYYKISNSLFPDKDYTSLDKIPYIPVSLFKNYLLKSIDNKEIFKILTSSGTTGSVPSKIVLDKETASLQSLTLSKILGHIIGSNRLPMLIIDSKSVIKDRKSFSARGAGILGVSVFGKKHLYVLDDKFELIIEDLKNFASVYNGKSILIFGFTFMIWQYLAKTDLGFDLDLSNAILLHSGGWKKLEALAVDNKEFKKTLYNKYGIKPNNIYNFYGMIEQVGTVFLENSQGYLQCPNFSDIIIRNPIDFSVQHRGEPGLIQVISMIPKSYPGHSILTEDIGVIVGEDDAENGWKGKYFKILGRAKKAETRGCSDTFK